MSRTVDASKQEDIYALIGRCVTAWADVDEALFEIFRYCVGPWEQSAIIYYKMPGLDPRFTTTDEIVKSFFPKPKAKSGEHVATPKVLEQWLEATKLKGRLLGERRRLAHSPVQFNGYMKGEIFYASSQVDLSDSERMRPSKEKTDPMTIPKIHLHYKQVTSLAASLKAFYDDVLTALIEEPPQRKSPHPWD